MGMPPTGKSIAITGISIERIAGGKMAETWVNFDLLGMLQQLGIAPALG
jgi:predicted ester cyclase